MKKYLSLFLILILGVTLVACGKDEHKKVFDEITIGYAQGDSAASVTNNLTLPVTSAVTSATITWLSSDAKVISNSGVVRRPIGDTPSTITLTLQVKINDVIKEKTFVVVVQPTVGNENPEDPGTGNGSNENPEGPGTGNVVFDKDTDGFNLIKTTEDFMKIVDFKSRYRLANDIDFNGGEAKPLGGWNGIGVPFSGTFDGNGYAIMNFTITGSKHSSLKDENGDSFGASLFPVITGVVRNLNIIGANITGSGFSGGISGIIEGTVLNVYFQGKVSSTKSWGSAESWAVPAGAIAGIVGGGNVSNVLVDAEVIGGHVFLGYAFKDVVKVYAVEETLGGLTEPLTGQDKEGDGEHLVKVLKDAHLVLKDNLKTITLSDSWSTEGANRPYLIRANKEVPNWAK